MGPFSSSPSSSSKSCLVNLLCRVGASTLGFPVADTAIHAWYPRGCVLCGTADHPPSGHYLPQEWLVGLKSVSGRSSKATPGEALIISAPWLPATLDEPEQRLAGWAGFWSQAPSLALFAEPPHTLALIISPLAGEWERRR